jgi:hypothetical protein
MARRPPYIPKQIKTPLRSTCSNRAKPVSYSSLLRVLAHGAESLRLSGFGGDSSAVRSVSHSVNQVIKRAIKMDRPHSSVQAGVLTVRDP